mmetsp:Transcript_120495/g.340907  ORF Transcript_120495/g.340907 Transcript_120495/m.340907 type:complete len:223 (+) Transcript_120495:151-819(+)
MPEVWRCTRRSLVPAGSACQKIRRSRLFRTGARCASPTWVPRRPLRVARTLPCRYARGAPRRHHAKAFASPCQWCRGRSAAFATWTASAKAPPRSRRATTGSAKSLFGPARSATWRRSIACAYSARGSAARTAFAGAWAPTNLVGTAIQEVLTSIVRSAGTACGESVSRSCRTCTRAAASTPTSASGGTGATSPANGRNAARLTPWRTAPCPATGTCAFRLT